METTIHDDSISFKHGEDTFKVTLQRTLRLPEDGKTHALPPGLGLFPLKRIEDYRDKVPAAWREHGGLFFPMWQREAMWLQFSASRRPFAVKVAAGKINAVSGKTWSQELAPSDTSGSGDPRQDYLVAPPQPWLDGFNTGKGTVQQFVSMPLGMGYTVEGQVTGKEDVGGIQILALCPKEGLLMPKPRPDYFKSISEAHELCSYEAGPTFSSASFGASSGVLRAATKGISTNSVASPRMRRQRTLGAEMGLGKGGTMTQKIFPDPHGLDVWDQASAGRLFLHIVNSEMYEAITGERPPKSPVTAQEYTRRGLPWFKLWDEEMGDVSVSPTLKGTKTIGAMDAQHGFTGQQDDSPVEEKVVSTGTITPGHLLVKDGSEW